ncbi:MAG: hypothetical protein M3R02_21360 [Chloroflexota bacterium]|nr:hypothetical protein [Chloroflexota bacterium]
MTDTTPRADAAPLSGPVAFAHHLWSRLAGDDLAEVPTATSDAYRAFQNAIRVLQEWHPEEGGPGGPITIADETAHSWANDAHTAGIAFGVAAEKLRRSLLTGGDEHG